MMLKSILPYGSGVPSLEEDIKSEETFDDMIPEHDSSSVQDRKFESGHDRDVHLAAEKHAYLHSQHGMDDSVF